MFFAANDGVRGFELWAMNIIPTPTRYFAVPACRVADTRGPTGPSGWPALWANTTRNFPMAGRCGIPPTAKAVALTVTVTAASAAGNLRIYPARAATVPSASAINFVGARPRSGNGVFRLGDSGEIAVRCDMPGFPAGGAHLILDVSGYFQ